MGFVEGLHFMAVSTAKRRNIAECRAVRRQQFNISTGRQAGQDFTKLQHRQRTIESPGIDEDRCSGRGAVLRHGPSTILCAGEFIRD